MKPLQLVQRSRWWRDFKMPFAAEQAKGFQSFARQLGALGLERTIRRVTQPFDFRRVEESEGAVVHGQPPPNDPHWGNELTMDLVWRDSVLDCGSPLPLSDCGLAFKSARGLAHSKTWRPFGRFLRLECRSRVQGLPRERRKRSVAWRASDCSRITVISSCPALDFSSARNVFRRPVVMPFRPAVGTSPPTNSRRARQPGFTRAGIGFSVATRFHLAEPVHVVRTDTANGALRPSL